MDDLAQRRRGALMGRVRSSGTEPEMRVRRLLHDLGYRYRVNLRSMLGKPDIVFPSRRKVLFVHGCFWHQHENCPKSRRPSTSSEFWAAKLDANVARDRRILTSLADAGWLCAVIWECETRDIISLRQRLITFLGPTIHRQRTGRISGSARPDPT